MLTRRLYAYLLIASAAVAAPLYKTQGDCQQGNGTITVSGITSSTSTLIQRSFPSCTVTIYTQGTTTPAAIYSDSAGTPLGNPFTAASNGHWLFYATDGRYDVRLSSGGIPTPFTLGDFTAIGYRKQSGSNTVDRNYGDKIYETLSVGDFGVLGDGSDETTKIQNAINQAITQGATLYFPPGTYKVTSTLTAYLAITSGFRQFGFGIKGGGYNVTVINIVPTGAIDAGLLVGSDISGADYRNGFQLSDISIIGNANVKYDLKGLRLVEAKLQNVALGGCNPTTGAAAYFLNLVGSTLINMIVDPNHSGGWPSGAATKDGIILDGVGFGNASFQNTIVTPTIQFVTGDALSIIGLSGGNAVSGGQISVNGRALVVNGDNNVFTSSLFEASSGVGGDAVTISGNTNSCIGCFFATGGAGNLHLAAPARANVFTNSQLPGFIKLDTGDVHLNRFENNTVFPTPTIIDGSTDTIWGSLYSYAESAAHLNYPSSRVAFPQVGQDLTTVISGTWISVDGSAVTVFPTPLVNGKAWHAIFNGHWLASSAWADPAIVGLSDSNPTFALFGSPNVSFAVSGGAFKMTAVATAGFTGTITFTPNSANVAGSTTGTIVYQTDALFDGLQTKELQTNQVRVGTTLFASTYPIDATGDIHASSRFVLADANYFMNLDQSGGTGQNYTRVHGFDGVNIEDHLGNKLAAIDSTGLRLLPKALAGLGAPANGTYEYCSDCKNVADGATAGAVCANAGTGSFARREGGAWRCN